MSPITLQPLRNPFHGQRVKTVPNCININGTASDLIYITYGQNGQILPQAVGGRPDGRKEVFNPVDGEKQPQHVQYFTAAATAAAETSDMIDESNRGENQSGKDNSPNDGNDDVTDDVTGNDDVTEPNLDDDTGDAAEDDTDGPSKWWSGSSEGTRPASTEENMRHNTNDGNEYEENDHVESPPNEKRTTPTLIWALGLNAAPKDRYNVNDLFMDCPFITDLNLILENDREHGQEQFFKPSGDSNVITFSDLAQCTMIKSFGDLVLQSGILGQLSWSLNADRLQHLMQFGSARLNQQINRLHSYEGGPISHVQLVLKLFSTAATIGEALLMVLNIKRYYPVGPLKSFLMSFTLQWTNIATNSEHQIIPNVSKYIDENQYIWLNGTPFSVWRNKTATLVDMFGEVFQAKAAQPLYITEDEKSSPPIILVVKGIFKNIVPRIYKTSSLETRCARHGQFFKSSIVGEHVDNLFKIFKSMGDILIGGIDSCGVYEIQPIMLQTEDDNTVITWYPTYKIDRRYSSSRTHSHETFAKEVSNSHVHRVRLSSSNLRQIRLPDEDRQDEEIMTIPDRRVRERQEGIRKI